ncbi:hypothetical protein GFS60_01328 [Rhodococcus sp. WAY2]|nr:hypothetical protein GFS60_01328 [Rhodococcus sp. WAY2]
MPQFYKRLDRAPTLTPDCPQHRTDTPTKTAHETRALAT